MKLTLTILGILLLNFVNAQVSQVKFKDQTFENGMKYPQVILDDKIKEGAINDDILKELEDLKASDFCIGQYGYVQKSIYLQIHVFCNCIDFEESQNRYYLYDIEEAIAIPYSALIEEKGTKRLSALLIEKTKTFASTKNIELPNNFIEQVEKSNLDAYQIVMKREGLDLWINSKKEASLFISWAELKPFMKLHFI